MNLESKSGGARGIAHHTIVAAGIALAVTFCLVPGLAGVRIDLQSDVRLALWPHPVATVAAGLAAVLLAAGTWVLRRGGTTVSRALLPLALLPCAFLGCLLVPLVPAAVAANLLFFLPVLLAGVSLLRFAAAGDACGDQRAVGVREIVITGIAFAAFFTFVGLYFTHAVGEHSGDEGHYLTQARSLWNDHDLDLRNDLANVPPDQLHKQHISLNSRRGWYSWHAPGLPLLLAPTVPAGLFARHAVLGSFAGLGCAGILALCRIVGARRAWSRLALLLFALSSFWAIYSSRALPEVAGAALTAWAVVAILRQETRPWGSIALVVVTCGLLPWLQTRFLPVSGACAGLFGLAALLERTSWSMKMRRLIVFGAAYVVAMAAFFAMQFYQFKGGLPLSAGAILFAQPAGMWHVLASNRGILFSLPLFAGLLAAALWALARVGACRRLAAAALILLCVTLATACATEFFAGGSCLPGRYLLVVTPLFVPCLASALERAGGTMRMWIAFLGLISVAEFVLVLARLPEFGKAFAGPRSAIGKIYALLEPAAQPLVAPTDSLLHPFALLLLGGTMALFLLPSARTGLQRLLVAAMFCGGIVAASGPSRAAHVLAGPVVVASRLDALGPSLERCAVTKRGGQSPTCLFAASDLFARSGYRPAGVTTAAGAAAPKDGLVALRQLQPNDWAGRGHVWATIIPPFRTLPGKRCCHLNGRLDGDVRAFLAVREGGRTLVEAPLAVAGGRAEAGATFACEGGEIHVLVRLEGGEGTLDDVKYSWSPFSDRLLRRAQLFLPESPQP